MLAAEKKLQPKIEQIRSEVEWRVNETELCPTSDQCAGLGPSLGLFARIWTRSDMDLGMAADEFEFDLVELLNEVDSLGPVESVSPSRSSQP